MKRIQKGQEKVAWSRVYICTARGSMNGNGCGATFLISKEDLRAYNEDYPGESGTCVFFRCIVCGKNTYIDIHETPFTLYDITGE